MDRQFQSSARAIGRRLALGMGVGVTLAPRFALAQADPARERPREGDLLVAVGATGGWFTVTTTLFDGALVQLLPSVTFTV